MGWRGRADQAAKVKGMFVRPEQVAKFLAKFEEADKARLTVTHDGKTDQLHVAIEADGGDVAAFSQAFSEIFKLRADIELVEKDSLPKDGMVIEDKRDVS